MAFLSGSALLGGGFSAGSAGSATTIAGGGIGGAGFGTMLPTSSALLGGLTPSAALGAAGAGASKMGGELIGGLAGAGPGMGPNMNNLWGLAGNGKTGRTSDAMSTNAESQRLQSGREGPADEMAATSTPIMESIGSTIRKNTAEIGKQALQKFSSAAMDNSINKMFTDSPTQRGLKDAQYANARFPGTNPWEQLGGGGGGPSQGGYTSARIGADASRNSANINQAVAQDRKQSEIEKAKAQTGETLTREQGIKLQNRWINRLSGAKQMMEINKGSLDSAKYNTEIEKPLQVIKQIAHEIQKTKEAYQDTNIKKAIANLSRLARENPTEAKWAGAAGALITAVKGLGRGPIGAILSPGKKKLIKGTNMSPKDWRQWRMDTGKINKETGELYP
nr:MAG: DNA pilot protein [Microvirus sp.]